MIKGNYLSDLRNGQRPQVRNLYSGLAVGQFNGVRGLEIDMRLSDNSANISSRLTI